MAPQTLATDTAVQKAVADEIGQSAAAEKQTIAAFLEEIQAMQASLQGETAQATQAKAAHLHEIGVQLANHLESISERVGVSAGGYMNIDSDGANSVASSGSVAF